jgi:aminoglycoside phosphotransferase (APT) family kinase protein
MNHDIERHGDRVIKRLHSWDLDQPAREWRALVLLARHAPGLAPAPIELRSDLGPPEIVMSHVAGEPLRGGRVLPHQVTALAVAVERLCSAIPPVELARLPPRAWPPAEVIEGLEAWCDRPLGDDVSPQIVRARAEGRRWLRQAAFPATSPPAFATGDGNLSNFLWDGQEVHVVDFEYSGRSDRAYELAEVTEHVAAWVDTQFDADQFLDCFALEPAEAGRLGECRRLLAFEWLHVLSQAPKESTLNPPGTLERQAERVLTRLDNPSPAGLRRETGSRSP